VELQKVFWAVTTDCMAVALIFLGTSGLGPKLVEYYTQYFFNMFYVRWINNVYKLYKQATIAL
jgi:hypothetical protein